MRDQIFISYSHKDGEWLNKFKINLKPYLGQRDVEAWDDTGIESGGEWQPAIDEALARAKVAVLLISSDFLASDFITKEELPYILDKAKTDDLKIVPVAVRHSAWTETPLKERQFVNNPNKPLSALEPSDADGELVRICGVVGSFFVERPRIIPGPEIERHSRSAEEALKALYEAMDDANVRGSVSASDATFEIVNEQINQLVYYKDLHDLLHTLQFRCYTYLMTLVKNARKDASDAGVWADVVNHEYEFDEILRRLRGSVHTDLSHRKRLAWIEKLVLDLEALFDAVQENDVEKIERAIKPVRNVLATEPARINGILMGAADALQLGKLIEALVRVCESLENARVRHETTEKFKQGISAFEQLRAGLDALIDSHDQWQNIDATLRMIERTLRIDLTDLEQEWDELKTKVMAQYVPSDEPWSKRFASATRKLDEAIDSGDAKLIEDAFMTFKTRANHRFYETDLSLKELCGQLRRVADPLDNVLERIKDF